MKRFFWIIGLLICMPLAACDDDNPETTDSARRLYSRRKRQRGRCREIDHALHDL